MDHPDIESWRISMSLPQLPSETLNRLSGNKKIMELVVSMTKRFVSLDRKAFAVRSLIVKELALEADCYKETPARKKINNAMKCPMLEKYIEKKHGEILSCEKQTKDLKLEIKNLEETIYKLLERVKGRERKTEIVEQYTRKLTIDRKENQCVIDFLKEIMETQKKKLNLKGDLALFRQKEKLLRTMGLCLAKLRGVVNDWERSKPPGSHENTLHKMTEMKQKLVYFMRNALGHYQVTYIFQCVVSLCDFKISQFYEKAAEYVRFESEPLTEECEELDEYLLSDHYLQWYRKENIPGDSSQTPQEKCEAVYRQLQEASVSAEALLAGHRRKMQALHKKIIRKLDSFSHHPEELQTFFGRQKGYREEICETLPFTVKKLNEARRRELKTFAVTPLISIEYMTLLKDEKTESYKCLSQFKRLPRNIIRDSLCSSSLMLADYFVVHGQILAMIRHILFIMNEYKPSPIAETDEGYEEKLPTVNMDHFNAFIHTLQVVDQIFYSAQVSQRFCLEPGQTALIPQKIKQHGKTAEEWRNALKLFQETQYG